MPYLVGALGVDVSQGPESSLRVELDRDFISRWEFRRNDIRSELPKSLGCALEHGVPERLPPLLWEDVEIGDVAPAYWFVEDPLPHVSPEDPDYAPPLHRHQN